MEHKDQTSRIMAHHLAHEELPTEHDDGFIKFLHAIIHLAVRLLALLMTLLILWGVADVVYVLYQRLMAPPFLLLKIEDIVTTFGAFLAVLIAIEIFINIHCLYTARRVTHKTGYRNGTHGHCTKSYCVPV